MLIDQMDEGITHKKQKTSENGFRDVKNYVDHEKAKSHENKPNASALWAESEKNFLDDVTMNLLPDDDDPNKSIKGTTAMKWDAQKKRYILKKVDREGRVIAEKRNESGKKITKKMKEKEKESIYKKW
jgi:hypothetical protein